MILAIDTATNLASLALFDQKSRQVLSEESWQSVNNHTVELMPRLVRMLDQQTVSISDLDGVVVSLGPGSFTGLRIGIGLAKGLVLSKTSVGEDQDGGVPLVGVPTLDVVARPHMEQKLPIWAILRAGRGRICAVHYTRTRGRARGRWSRQEPYQLTTIAELCNEIEGDALLCGEIDAEDAQLIRRRLGPSATIASPAASLRRAAYLAELGWERLVKGQSDQATSLAPIYPQNPQIDG
ncbi:tRNA (adenosine(37)-N6)-threonylcarbamoyltransferase complex dimerization subunit type 1 TsaB [Chloroflexota bacterium]